MEENKKEVKVMENVNKEVEKIINSLIENCIEPNNVETLYQLIDIHKDIANENYWKVKEESMKYRNYNNYGNEYGEGSMGNYGDGSYGRRGRGRERDSRGRYKGGRGSGNYRGEEIMDDMYQNYQAYSDSSEQYSRGNYGAKEDTMMSLEYMLESMVDFVEMLKHDTNSQEEANLIKKYMKQISEM